MKHAINIGTEDLPEYEYVEPFKERGAWKIMDGLGVTHPPSYLKKWSESDKNSRGIYVVTPGSFDNFSLMDTGARILSSTLINGRVVETIVTEDIPLADIKERELNLVYDDYEASMQPIKLGYPKSERETWPKQEAQALAYQADNTAVTPFLTKLVETKKIKNPELTLADMAQRILDKVAAFEVLAGEITGLKQNKQEAIEIATTVQEVRDAVGK